MKELDQLLTATREIIQNRVMPLEPIFLQQGFGAVLPKLEAVRQEVKAAGLWGAFLPPEYNGVGLSLPDYARLSEELGHTPLGHFAFNCQAPDVGNMEVLIRYGNDE